MSLKQMLVKNQFRIVKSRVNSQYVLIFHEDSESDVCFLLFYVFFSVIKLYYIIIIP